MGTRELARFLKMLGMVALAVVMALSAILPSTQAFAVGVQDPAKTPSDATPSGKSPGLVLLANADLTSFQQTMAIARENGAAVSLAFPPDAFIAELPPAAEAALRQHPSVSQIERGAVGPDRVRSLPEKAAGAARAWNTVYQGVPDPIASKKRTGPAPARPDSDVRVPPAKTSASLSGPVASAPNVDQTSEFMAGTVVASVVFVESNSVSGNCPSTENQTENWSDGRRDAVLVEIAEGLAFWTNRGSRPDPLTFYVDNLGYASTSCEPINRPTSDQDLWVADALKSLGYASAAPYSAYSLSRTLASDRRAAYGADWGYVIFVVDSDVDPNGQFSDYGFAYAYLSGPFMVMTYDNDGWGIGRTNLVFAHETGHIFGALDEYRGSCSPTDTWGYFSVANASCNDGGILTDLSIMGDGGEQESPSVDVSTSARSAIGWRNPTSGAGGKTVVDVVKTSTVSLTAYSPDPTTDATPTYSASGGNTAFPPSTACNTLGGWCYRYPSAVTVSKVSGAEWSLDGGAYTTAGVVPTDTDSAFNQQAEPYTFTPTSGVAGGTHTFRTRSMNNFGSISSVAADTLKIGVPAVCYTLTRSHSGAGADPVASPANSSGCASGQYVAGQSITLTASPAAGYRVSGWTGTSNGASTSTTNSLTMPASNRAVSVAYTLAPQPDLKPTALTAPDSGSLRQSITFTWTVNNQGVASAPATWTDRLYLSMDTVLGSGDVSIGSKSRTTTLAAGSSYTVSVKVRLPSGTATGSYYLIVRTDDGLRVVESDEGNNTLSRPFTVTQ